MLGQARRIVVELGQLLIDAVTASIVELGPLLIDAVTASIRSASWMDSSIAPHRLPVLCACFQFRTVPSSACERADTCMPGQARQIMAELGHLLIDAVTESIRVVHEGQPGWTLT